MQLPVVFIGNKKSAGRGKFRPNSKALTAASSAVVGASNQQIDQTTDCFDDTKNFPANIRSGPHQQSTPKTVVHETKSPGK